MRFKVVAIFTRGGDFERREVEYFDCVVDAFARWGYQAAVSNGAAVFDDQDCVWAEHRGGNISVANDDQRRRFMLYMDTPREGDRVRYHGPLSALRGRGGQVVPCRVQQHNNPFVSVDFGNGLGVYDVDAKNVVRESR